MMTISRKARKLIDKYLSGVERALEHLDSGERREVLEGLRAHIHEALAEHSHTPSAEDVRAVLQSMDTPESYTADREAGPRSQVRGQSLGRLGFFLLVAGLVSAALGLLLGATVSDALLRVSLIIGGVLALCALGFGIAGWRDPYGKAAVIGAVLILAAATVFFPTQRTATGPSDPEITMEEVGGNGD